jgi:hypothetical protein
MRNNLPCTIHYFLKRFPWFLEDIFQFARFNNHIKIPVFKQNPASGFNADISNQAVI